MQPKKQQTRLLERLPGALIVLTAHESLQLTADMAAPFRQDASFLWLTGIEEAGWKAIYDTKEATLTLVRPKKSAMQVTFDGESDDDAIKKVSSAHTIIGAKDFEQFLRQKARKHSVVYTIYDQSEYDFVVNPAQKQLHLLLERIFASVLSCKKELNELKAIKLPEEIATLQKSIDITIGAFETLKKSLPELKYEYQVEALFSYAFGNKYADHAYQPIVASGKNACTLHYINNDAALKKGQMILLDIGARYDGYCADITRTYAVGTPTKRQRQIHQAVEAAHHEIIKLLKPGLSVEEYSRNVDIRMKQALQQVGLLQDLDDIETYRKYFPHAISHGLGIDVHDSLGGPRYFESGMVLTVEPGIYVPEEKIGVRIEDDIVITKTGHRNLSAKLNTALE